MNLRTAAVVLALLGAMGTLATPTEARAQLSFEADEPRVFSIQPRPYRLGHEFGLGVGVLPLDAFYVGLVLSAQYTYHFTDFWAWEIANAGYSINIDTSLEDDLLNDFGVLPARGGGERIRFFASTGLVVKPLFGKLAWFNNSILYSETFFNLGVGPFLVQSANGEQDFWRIAINAGLGIRFWSGEALSVRVDIRDYLHFDNITPENALLFQLSATFNVFDAEEADRTATDVNDELVAGGTQ